VSRRRRKILLKGAQIWFTDGSMKNGRAGAGIYSHSPHIRISIPLGRYATVFQAEVFAF
jgi:hypothetical protein